MTKITVAITAALSASLLLLTACSSTPHEVRRGKDSREEGESIFAQKSAPSSRTVLQVPPDLLASANEKVRENASAVETAAAAGDSTDNSAGQVLPQIIGASIESESGRSWLRVDADAELVWRKLTEFWEYQEIALAASEPRAGLMETDWFAKGKRGGGLGAELLSLLNQRTALDKFTLRLERDGEGGTNVFVTHRHRERIAKEYANLQKSNDYEWVEREQDAEKVAQLLQTIVLLFEQT